MSYLPEATAEAPRVGRGEQTWFTLALLVGFFPRKEYMLRKARNTFGNQSSFDVAFSETLLPQAGFLFKSWPMVSRRCFTVNYSAKLYHFNHNF